MYLGMMELLGCFSGLVDVFVNEWLYVRKKGSVSVFLLFVSVVVDTEDCLFRQAWKVFCYSYDILSLDFKVRGQKYC